MDENKEILPDIKNIKTQETYTLPSKGIVYSPEDGIPASITLRRMTTREDKMRLRNQSEDRVRRDILQACIMEQGVDAGKLKLMDANFLLFRLRAISLLDDTYKVTCRCPHCGTEFIHEVNLKDVPVEYMSEDKLKKMKVQLPISQANIDFKFPSLSDIISFTDNIKEYMKRFPEADMTEVIFSTTPILYIDRINGHTLMKEELEQYLSNMDILDSRALTDIIQDLDITFGFTENLTTLCPNCKSEVTHGLPITRELFTPSK